MEEKRRDKKDGWWIGRWLYEGRNANSEVVAHNIEGESLMAF